MEREKKKKGVLGNKELELCSWVGGIHNEVNKGIGLGFFLIAQKTNFTK